MTPEKTKPPLEQPGWREYAISAALAAALGCAAWYVAARDAATPGRERRLDDVVRSEYSRRLTRELSERTLPRDFDMRLARALAGSADAVVDLGDGSELHVPHGWALLNETVAKIAVARALAQAMEQPGGKRAAAGTDVVDQLAARIIEAAKLDAAPAADCGAPALTGDRSPECWERQRTDPLPAARLAAVDAIAKLGKNKKTVASLTATLGDDQMSCVRARAAEALGTMRMDEPDGLRALVQALQDSDPNVVAEAHKALAKSGKPAAAMLVDVLSGREPKLSDGRGAGPVDERARGVLRQEAAKVLTELGSVAVRPLATLLDDPDVEQRRVAIHLLGEIGPAAHDARDPLSGLQRDDKLRADVAEALRKINGTGDPR